MTLETAVGQPSQPPTAKLSTNRRLLLKGLAEGKSIADAAVDARMLRTSAYRAIDDMREQLPALMDGVGLDVRSILCRIREKCDAHETKFFQFEGKVTQQVDVEAHGVQLKALELAVSLRPELAKPEATHIGTVNVLFAGALPDWTEHKGNSDSLVHSDSKADGPPPLSPLEGTGPGPGGHAHTNPGHVDGINCVNTPSVPVTVASADGKFSGASVPAVSVPVTGVPVTSVPAKSKLSSRVVKKRVARLPVYRP